MSCSRPKKIGSNIFKKKSWILEFSLERSILSHPIATSVKDNPWKQVSLTFYPYANFYLMFEAESGDGYRSDMAIDEIRISRGMCLDCTGAGLFSCGDEEATCILKEFSCDGYRDCPNGADEEECLDEPTQKSIENACKQESLTNLPVCRPDNYKTSCVDGTEGSQLCDGKWDCLYGSDEAGCR